MEYFQFQSIRTKRILEWRILVLLFISIIIISSISIRIFLSSGEDGDFDYFYFQHESLELFGEHESNERVVVRNSAIIKEEGESFLPVIFIGGYPRSGARVLKEVIEKYGNIKCNTQTNVIPDFLQLWNNWNISKVEMNRLDEAGIYPELLRSSYGVLTREIVIGQSPPSQQIHCVHEDESYKFGEYLNYLFPTIKFVFVVRDGRAVVHSLQTKPHGRPDYSFPSYYEGFVHWGNQMERLLAHCSKLGDEKCYIVRFEDLFLSPWETLELLFNFLGIQIQIPVDLSKSPVQNTSLVWDYLSHRPILDQETINDAGTIDGILEAFGYDPKLYVAGNSAQDFET